MYCCIARNKTFNIEPDISSGHPRRTYIGLGCGVFAARKSNDAADLRGYDCENDLQQRTTR